MTSIDPALLLPAPKRFHPGEGACALDRLQGWTSPAGGGIDEADLARLADELAGILGRALPRRPGDGAAGLVVLRRDEGIAGNGPDRYRLEIARDGIRIAGATARAVFHGLQTLRQVIELADDGSAPGSTIEDWPSMEWRGYSDDVSRRQVSALHDFEDIIRQLARWKYTVYQPYLEDMLAIDGYPLVGLDRGHLTHDEVRYLVAFARRHFIELVPQLNSLSHQEHLLALPGYAAWSYRGNRECVDPRLPEVRAYFHEVWQQIFALFPSRYVHLGLDEARVLYDERELFLEHANWLAELALAAGRRPIAWHDMWEIALPPSEQARLLGRTNPELVMNVWGYSPGPGLDQRLEFMGRALERGLACLISPMVHSHSCGADIADQWRQSELQTNRAIGNPRVLGTHITTWNDAGDKDRHLHHRGLAVNAEMAWNGARPGMDPRAVGRAIAIHRHGLRAEADSDTLARAANLGLRAEVLAGRAAQPPRELALQVGSEEVAVAEKTLAEIAALTPALEACRTRARRQPEQIEHALAGLRRLLAGAMRVTNAPHLRSALRADDAAAVAAIAALEIPRLHELRRDFAASWLRRCKPQGLEHADLRFRTAIAALEALPDELRRQRAWHGELSAEGFRPLPLAEHANWASRDLAAIPRGATVLDAVPWLLPDPDSAQGSTLVRMRGCDRKDLPERVEIPVAGAASRLHILHAAYGSNERAPGAYVIHYADGRVQRVVLRPGVDVADWWNPYGHPLGGGGALRLDPATCRLAVRTGASRAEFEYGIYHLRVPIEHPDAAIARIAIEAGDPACSLVILGITLETGAVAREPRAERSTSA